MGRDKNQTGGEQKLYWGRTRTLEQYCQMGQDRNQTGKTRTIPTNGAEKETDIGDKSNTFKWGRTKIRHGGQEQYLQMGHESDRGSLHSKIKIR